MRDFADVIDDILSVYDYAVAHGGASVDPETLEHASPSAGRYFVAIGKELRIPVNADEFQRVEQFEALAVMAAEAQPGTLVGLWVDNDEFCGDVSIATDSLDDAISIGFENNQLAIYDGLEDREIHLTPDMAHR